MMKLRLFPTKSIQIEVFPLSITFDKGKAKLFYKSIEITKDVGFSSSIRLFEHWTDASLCQWEVIETTKNTLSLHIFWKNIPVSQTWTFTINNLEITWEISMHVTEELILDEVKVGIMLSHKYSHWLSTSEKNSFPLFSSTWEEIPLVQKNSQLLGAYTNETSLPAITFNFSINQGPLFPQIQNSPKKLNTHVLSAYTMGLNNTNIYTEGTHKVATINLQVFPTRNELFSFHKQFIFQNTIELESNKQSDTIPHSDILFVMPPPWETKMPPLGIAYLSSFLQQHEFSASVLDLNVLLFNRAIARQRTLWDISLMNNLTPQAISKNFLNHFGNIIDYYVDRIIDSKINIIGFSVTFISLLIAESIAKKIKEKDNSRIILFGGPGCFWPNDRALLSQNTIDYFIIGEGEQPLLELMKHNIQPCTIQGITTSTNAIEINPITSLENITSPTFEQFDLSQYNAKNEYQALPILISRGCIGRCSYCIDHKMNMPFRTRTAQSVFEEIQYHIRHNSISNFELNDLLCNGNLTQLEELSDLIIKNKLKIQWISYAMIRKDMSLTLLKKMYSAGCRDLCYGLESGSDMILKRMNKYYTSQEAETLIRNTHTSGINTRINIIVGFPGETDQHFKETKNFLSRNRKYIDEITNISTLVVNPGSTLGQDPKHFGIHLKNNNDFTQWTDQNNTDYTTRKNRVDQVLTLAKKLGIKSNIVNAPEV